MRAVLQLRLTDREGRVVATRRAANTVLVSGAQLIAGLFRGEGGPITHMGVGTSDADADDVTGPGTPITPRLRSRAHRTRPVVNSRQWSLPSAPTVKTDSPAMTGATRGPSL